MPCCWLMLLSRCAEEEAERRTGWYTFAGWKQRKPYQKVKISVFAAPSPTNNGAMDDKLAIATSHKHLMGHFLLFALGLSSRRVKFALRSVFRMRTKTAEVFHRSTNAICGKETFSNYFAAPALPSFKTAASVVLLLRCCCLQCILFEPALDHGDLY